MLDSVIYKKISNGVIYKKISNGGEKGKGKEKIQEKGSGKEKGKKNESSKYPQDKASWIALLDILPVFVHCFLAGLR